MIGIKESKEFVLMTAKVPVILKGALSDGAGLEDVGALISAIQLAANGITGLDQVDDELADLTQEEKAELVNVVLAEIGGELGSEKDKKIAELIVESALNIASAVILYSK